MGGIPAIKQGSPKQSTPIEQQGISGFVSDLHKRRYIPKDQYSHASILLDTENPIDVEDIAAFAKVVSGRELLANINNDQLLQLYQEDARILTHLLDMARRDPTFVYPFFVLYSSWAAELSLTRTRDGMERILQADVGVGYHPSKDIKGFGEELFAEQEEQDKPSLLGKLGKKLEEWRAHNKQKWWSSGGDRKRYY